MRKVRVIITVDTEPSIAGAMEDRTRFPPLLDEPVWGEVSGRSEALGFITRTLQKQDQRATFFVETVHTAFYGEQPMQRYTDHLMQCGQDIQLHIHPVWRNFRLPEASGQVYFDDCAELDGSELIEIVEQGCEQIRRWTGNSPVAMRTGNFSTSREVYRAMAACNMPLASNICIAASRYAESQLTLAGGVHQIEGVYELPALCFVDRGPVGGNRHRAAQITACSSRELIRLLKQCREHHVDSVVLVTHPFEFLKKADFRYNSLQPNRVVQKRLEAVCAFLAENEKHFDVTTFADLAKDLPLQNATSPRLDSSIPLSLSRAAQNYLNDRL